MWKICSNFAPTKFSIMGKPLHNTHFREYRWDYRQPAIYLLTFTTTDRHPLLGTLVGEADKARVEPSEIGWRVTNLFSNLPTYYPQLQVLSRIVMPDHFHAIVRVIAPLEHPLGYCMRGFKWACNKEWKALSPETDYPLFASDFYPSRLQGPGQLQIMFDYLRDNPRRLAIKRQYPGYFRIQRDVTIENSQWDTVGNQCLLLAPRIVAVHVRRAWDAEQKRAFMNECILAARQGAVLISPFISEAERAVRDEALKEHLSIIVVHDKPLPELYKPEPMYFDACMDGRILIIAPLKDRFLNTELTYAQCKELNAFAEAIASSHNVAIG